MASTEGKDTRASVTTTPMEVESPGVTVPPSSSAPSSATALSGEPAISSSASSSSTSSVPQSARLRPLEGERVYLSSDLEDLAHLSELITKDEVGAILVDDPSKATCAVLSISPVGPQMLPSPDADKLARTLLRQGIRVYGSKCVKESIEMKKPLPRSVGHAVISRAFEDVVMACDTELLTEMGTALREVVELMNGHFVGDQLPSCTTVLCGKAAYSQAFQVASQRGIPIVRTTWVSSCFKEQAMLGLTKDFVLPPMSGCVVCVTGLSLTTRQYVQQMVVSLGGAFSAEFSKRCTHLIAISPTGPKFKASQLWRIPAVSLDWLLDCINMNACQPTTSYIVSEPTTHDINLPLQFAPTVAAAAAAANAPVSAFTSAAAAATNAAAASATVALLNNNTTERIRPATAPGLPFSLPANRVAAVAASASSIHHHRRISEGAGIHKQPYIIVTNPTRAAPAGQPRESEPFMRALMRQMREQHLAQIIRSQQQVGGGGIPHQLAPKPTVAQQQQQQQQQDPLPLSQPLHIPAKKHDESSVVLCFRTPQPIKESRTPSMEASGQQPQTPPSSPRRIPAGLAATVPGTRAASLDDATSKLQSALSQLLDACDTAITSLGTTPNSGITAASTNGASQVQAAQKPSTTPGPQPTDPTFFSP